MYSSSSTLTHCRWIIRTYTSLIVINTHISCTYSISRRGKWSCWRIHCVFGICICSKSRSTYNFWNWYSGIVTSFKRYFSTISIYYRFIIIYCISVYCFPWSFSIKNVRNSYSIASSYYIRSTRVYTCNINISYPNIRVQRPFIPPRSLFCCIKRPSIYSSSSRFKIKLWKIYSYTVNAFYIYCTFIIHFRSPRSIRYLCISIWYYIRINRLILSIIFNHCGHTYKINSQCIIRSIYGWSRRRSFQIKYSIIIENRFFCTCSLHFHSNCQMRFPCRKSICRWPSV